jgi:hypothetical protein
MDSIISRIAAFEQCNPKLAHYRIYCPVRMLDFMCARAQDIAVANGAPRILGAHIRYPRYHVVDAVELEYCCNTDEASWTAAHESVAQSAKRVAIRAVSQ